MVRGSVSPFEIILSGIEREELERRSRCYTASYAQVVRAKIVLLAAEGGRTWTSPLGSIPARRWFTAGVGGSSSSA